MPDSITARTDIASIKAHVLSNTKNVVPTVEADAQPKRGIDSPAQLERGVREVLSDLQISADQAAAVADNRVKVFSWCPPAQGYLGQQVTMSQWKNIVWRAVNAMINDYRIKQFNGDWQVLRWDYDGAVSRFYDRVTQNGSGPYAQDRRLPEERQKAGTSRITETMRHLLLVVVVVDVSGSDDIQFNKKDGTPLDDAPMSSRDRSIAAGQQELAEQQVAILNRLDGANETDALRRQLAQLAAQVEALTSAQAASTTPAPKKRRTPRKKATAKASPVEVEALPEPASNADITSQVLVADDDPAGE